MWSMIRTIQSKEDLAWVRSYVKDQGKGHFPLPCVPQRSVVGGWLYIVYQGVVVCRFRILDIEPRFGPEPVGSDDHPIDARCAVIVQMPATPVQRVIRMRGFMGIRYVPPPGAWNQVERLAKR